MINIVFYNAKSKELLGYKINGHSGYAPVGEDIICASVSSVSQMVANTITEVLKVKAQIVLKDAVLSVRISQADAQKCSDILNGLKLHLTLLEEQYPKYMNINYTEV